MALTHSTEQLQSPLSGQHPKLLASVACKRGANTTTPHWWLSGAGLWYLDLEGSSSSWEVKQRQVGGWEVVIPRRLGEVSPGPGGSKVTSSQHVAGGRQQRGLGSCGWEENFILSFRTAPLS